MNWTGKQNETQKTGKAWIERLECAMCSGWIEMRRNFWKMICDWESKIYFWMRKT
jgi:hypothetical protein